MYYLPLYVRQGFVVKSEVFLADEELNRHTQMKRSHPTFVIIKQQKKLPVSSTLIFQKRFCHQPPAVPLTESQNFFFHQGKRAAIG